MFKLDTRFGFCLGLALAFAGLPGCQPSAPAPTESHSDDHEEHSDHVEAGPEDFAPAVKQVAEMKTKIIEALEQEDPSAAHDPLHDIGHALETVEASAKKLDVPAEDREKIDGAVDSLFESFTAIDDTFHGKEGKTIDQVRESIDSSIKTLQGYVNP